MAPTATERPALPRALRRDSAWTLGLLGVTALAWAFGGRVSYLVLLSGPATIAFGISALINSKGVDAAKAIRVWLVIAVGVGGLSFIAGLGLILMRGPIEQLEACMSRAITESAKRECLAQYQTSYEELLSRYGVVTTP